MCRKPAARCISADIVKHLFGFGFDPLHHRRTAPDARRPLPLHAGRADNGNLTLAHLPEPVNRRWGRPQGDSICHDDPPQRPPLERGTRARTTHAHCVCSRTGWDCAIVFLQMRFPWAGRRVTAFVMTTHRNAHRGKGEPVSGQRMPIVLVPGRGGIAPSFFSKYGSPGAGRGGEPKNAVPGIGLQSTISFCREL